jgi:xanthine dehydrogenase YagR molybdenum-binding subunit
MNARLDELPTSMPTDNRPMNRGTSMNDDTSRLDGVAKVTGTAKYGRDQYLPNSLFVGFVRCPFGAGELESYDEAAAKAVPGVVEAEVNGKDAQYHGHTVGHVAAESPLALARGLIALAAKWKKRDCKTRITDEPLSMPELNEKAAAALASADHVLEAEYTTQVQTHSSLETHGAVIDHRGDSATCYVSTQGTFAATDGLGEAIGLPRARYEVVCEYVGGGFGSKLNGAGKEGATAARVAARHKRPVYLFVNREEDHLDTGNRPSLLARVKIGFAKDGTVLGGLIRTWGGVGVSRGGGGAALPSGRYRLGDIQREHSDVRFNAGAPRPFRAPGHPQGAFVEELMLDEIASAAGVDPLELRLRVDADADRRDMMRLGAKLIGWDRRAATGSQATTIRRGFGMGTTTWGGGAGATECEVVINRDGSVEARTGTQDIGTGQRTTMAVVAASVLGVPLHTVTTRVGRSTLPIGPGSGGSTTSPSTAPVMAAAAAAARKQFLTAMANLSGGDASEFDLKDGRVLRGGAPHLPWADACARIGGDQIVGRAGSRDAERGQGHSHGVQFVELDVDVETGVVRVRRIVAVQACGRVIARKTAESQVIGAVIQGISYALFEDRVLDRNVGAMVNANMDMYKIAGTMDMPRIEPILWTRGQTGVRSLGEPPTIPTAGAIACAVFNAVGAPVRSLPITPDKVLAALEGAAR